MIAWGNALEDLAHYCAKNPETSYKASIEKFAEAEKASLRIPRDPHLAILCRGRCRYRRVYDIIHKGIKATDDIDGSRNEINRSIVELKSVVNATTKSFNRAEASYFLGWTYDLLYELENDIAFIKEADAAFGRAVDLETGYRWPQYQLDWAKYAYHRNRTDDAIARATQLVEETPGDENRAFEALSLIFVATPREKQKKLVDEYLNKIPDIDSTRCLRCRWLLLFANQARKVETTNQQLDVYEESAVKALGLLKDGDDPQLVVEANFAAGVIAFLQYGKSRQNADLMNAARQMLVAARLTANPQESGLVIGRAAQIHDLNADIQKRALELKGQNKRAWETHKGEVEKVLEEFYRNAQLDSKQRQVIRNLISGIKGLTYPG